MNTVMVRKSSETFGGAIFSFMQMQQQNIKSNYELNRRLTHHSYLQSVEKLKKEGKHVEDLKLQEDTQVEELSNDINVLTAEVMAYKQIVGQSVWEIGRRLKKVKDEDLVHGEFERWVESVGIHPRMARRFMKIADELPNRTPVSDLGVRALYAIATIPEDEREKLHAFENGKKKTVYEMSTRELEKLKSEIISRNTLIQDLKDENEVLRNTSPIIKRVEVAPDDYDDLLEAREYFDRKTGRLENKILELKGKIQDLEEQKVKNVTEEFLVKEKVTALKKQMDNMTVEISHRKKVQDFSSKVSIFFEKEMVGMLYSESIKQLNAEDDIQSLTGTVNSIQEWCDDMRKILEAKGDIVDLEVE